MALLSFHLDTRRLILYIIPLVPTLVNLLPPSYTYKTDQLIIYRSLYYCFFHSVFSTSAFYSSKLLYTNLYTTLEKMNFQEIYTETNEKNMFQDIDWKEFNSFQDFEWQQNLENILPEQLDLMEYEEPSIYNNQMPSDVYFSTAPRYTRDQAQYDEFVFDQQAGPTYSSLPSSPPSSPLTRLNISTPPWSVLPTEQTPSARGSTQENGPKKATKSCEYAYKPLEIAPASWDIFEYNSFGELEPGRAYSAQELLRYLYCNPQHQVNEKYNPKLGGFTLWIQRTPRASAFEYVRPRPEADLCRFRNCEHNNVIKAGDVRVAFDELTNNTPNLDPKHNAGYAHLSCLEKQMDFPMLCKDMEVKPENRVLPLEWTQKNPMILQDRTELDHVQRFIDFCNVNGRAPLSYPVLGTLYDEISRLGPSEWKRPALDRWQRGGVEWDDVDKAKKNHAKKLAKAKKDDTRAKKEAAKKRAPCGVWSRVRVTPERSTLSRKGLAQITRPLPKQMESSYARGRSRV